MSLTYCAKNYSTKDFDCNSAGADLLYALHRACGAAVDEPPARPSGRRQPLETSRVPFQATAQEARQMAIQLQIAEPAVWLSVLRGPDGALWGGTAEEWVEHVRDWIQFLRTCGGYEAR